MSNIEIPEEFRSFNRYCPVCNTGSDSFGSYGDAKVPDARCPNCTTMERYRLLYLYLRNETNFFSKKQTVLDIGPRTEFSRLCSNQENLTYVSIDLSSPRAMIKSDITQLPFSQNSFDTIFCYHVLEHVPEQKALRELHRVLKPEGNIYIQVPIDISRSSTFEVSGAKPEDYEILYGQKDHLRVYGTNFSKVLKNAGFRVQQIKYINKFDEAERVKLGLKDTYKLSNYYTCEDIFIASK